MIKNILFTGGSSLLAQGWVRNSQNQYNYVLALNQRQIDRDKFITVDMDYSSVSKIKSKLKFVKPEAVINCIGLTNIEECENKPQFAFEANVEIAGKIAKACLSQI